MWEWASPLGYGFLKAFFAALSLWFYCWAPSLSVIPISSHPTEQIPGPRWPLQVSFSAYECLPVNMCGHWKSILVLHFLSWRKDPPMAWRLSSHKEAFRSLGDTDGKIQLQFPWLPHFQLPVSQVRIIPNHTHRGRYRTLSFLLFMSALFGTNNSSKKQRKNFPAHFGFLPLPPSRSWPGWSH